MRGRIGDALFDGFNDGSDLLLVSVEVRGLVWIVGGYSANNVLKSWINFSNLLLPS